jgi:hypothetical protein
VRNKKFKNGKNAIRPRTLRKLTRAIDDLQNKEEELTGMESGVCAPAIENGQ